MPIYFDATFSWSGYSYQGKVGMFIVLKKLNGYDGDNIENNFIDWSIEFEWLEDFSIKKGRIYKSLHQVKTLKSRNIDSYIKAINQTLENAWSEYTYYIKPYFHVSSNVNNPHNIFYPYTIDNTNKRYCPLDKIDKLLKDEVKLFLRRHNVPDYDGNCEDLHFLKLLSIIDNHVKRRHQNIQRVGRKTSPEQLEFITIINSLKTDSRQFTNERMIYEKKEYLVKLVDEVCQDIDKNLQKKINIFIRDLLDLNDNSFVKFSKSIFPHIKSLFDAQLTIEDFQNLLHRDNMIDVFFKIIQEIQKNGVFQEHRYLYTDEKKYLVTAISSSDKKRITKGILENPFAVEDLYEMDFFITERIKSCFIETEANNISEIRDEDLLLPEEKENKITELKKVQIIDIEEAQRSLND